MGWMAGVRGHCTKAVEPIIIAHSTRNSAPVVKHPFHKETNSVEKIWVVGRGKIRIRVRGRVRPRKHF